jgi:Flp pilus assembly protein CpaB
MSGRPFTIIGAVLAVVALGAFLLLGSRGGAGALTPPPATNLKAVVVAAHDILARIPLTTADVKIVQMDTTSIPPQAFSKVDLVKGLIPVVSILQNQPVTGNLLVASSDQVTGAQAAFLPIPKGYVAKTIPTSDQQGVGGYITPGDYITIEALMSPPGGFANTNERTIFTNVHVLRAGPASNTIAPVGKATPAPTTSSGATSLTIVVTQCQAEIIDWFIANGSIKYTLESYKDYTPRDVAVDASCPNVDAAGGVTKAVIQQKFPGFVP